jgi:hypothetical protein
MKKSLIESGKKEKLSFLPLYFFSIFKALVCFKGNVEYSKKFLMGWRFGG